MPNEQKVTRKLRAILSADVKGYSILMADDEVFTIKTIKEYRGIMSLCIEQHNGRVVDSPGDNMLAEFASAVDAVQCAVEMQKLLKKENDRLVENKRLEFRIGVNIGDVVQDENRIYGDGVNIAARIEGLADPTGICVSRSAYDQIKKKLGFGFEYLGEHPVKNISEPVRVYKVLTDSEDVGKLIGERPKREVKKWILPIIILAAVTITSLVWYIIQSIDKPEIETASVENMALPLPDKPSIAVLPFVNMSDDPEQEYFSDGITEDIITALSKTPKMLVIARNSTFSYKGRAVKIKEIAEELGVQYVLEGSVRKAGDRIRINAQLIDSISGHHVWAERYDRDLKDVFALQDEITIKIISALKVNLTDGEIARVSAMRTQNLEAYLITMKAREYMMRLNKEDNSLSQQLAQKAIDLDPGYPFPYALLAWTHWMDVWFRTSKSPKQSMGIAFKLAQKALSIDSSLVSAHVLLSYLYTFKRQYEKGIAEAEKSLEINPNYADGHCHKARVLHYVGNNKAAIDLYKKAIRLNPFPPSYYYYQLGYCYFMMEQYEQAIAELKKALDLQPKNLPAFVCLAATYGISNRDAEALSAGNEISKIAPKFSVENWVKKLPYKNETDNERLRKGLYKAGFPE